MNTKELERRWVEQWKITGPLLEKIKTEELRAMTDEEGRAAAEMILYAVPSPHDWRPDPLNSGFVEQQSYFRRALTR